MTGPWSLLTPQELARQIRDMYQTCPTHPALELLVRAERDAAALREVQAENTRLREWLTKISDPSYVGNYSDAEVVEIYRKWAARAVSPPAGEESR